MKSKKILLISILAIIIFFFIYYIGKHLSDFKQLASVGLANIWLVLVAGVILFINLALNGYILDVLMHSFGLKLKLKEWFGLAMITNFYNYITPFRGGMIARAVYLKKKHKVPYVHFLATLGAVYIIIFLVGSIAGMLSMFFIWKYTGLFNKLIFFLFLAIFLVLLAVIIFSPKFHEKKNKWLNRIIKVINGWHLIKNNKKVVFSTLTISLIQLSLGAISNIILYLIFGVHIGFFMALFLAAISSIAILVSITPGNLGIGDAINVFSAAVIGIGLTSAVAATILGRAINLLIIFILGPIFSYVLLKHKPKAKARKKK